MNFILEKLKGNIISDMSNAFNRTCKGNTYLIYNNKSILGCKISVKHISFQGRPQRGPEWKRPGSVFQPMTWKPRWLWQVTFLGICFSTPILQTFFHSYVPGLDWFTEIMVYNVQYIFI